jgi:hypothetical protein
MKKRTARRVIVFLFLCTPAVVRAQSYHRLAARDFTGSPPAENGDIAYTKCDVEYTYQVVRHNRDYDVTFDVRLNMDNYRSYIRLDHVSTRDQLQQILRHEQGHYNIAFLLKCEAYSVLTHHRYTANYHREIDYLFKQVEAKYQKMNADYEAMTEHMLNDQNQEKWNAWFSRQIDNVSLASAN